MYYQDTVHFVLKRATIGLALVLLVLLVASSDNAEMQVQEQQYCEMVELFIQTNGREGWPDYNESYKTSCLKNTQQK